MALNPKLKIIAPWREWNIRSREDALDYAAEHNVPVTATIKTIYSRDRNLWHLSHEGGILEDPWNEPEEAMFQLTRQPGRGARRSRSTSRSTSSRACPSASTAWRWGRSTSCRR